MELRQFFENAADGVMVVDRADRIVYWNESAAGILGYSRRDAIGARCYEVLNGLGERGSVVCGPECSLKDCAFRGERIHGFNLLTTHKNGHRVWLNMSTMCATDFEGLDTVVVHMFRDIDRLQRATDLLGEFVIRAAEVTTPVPLPARVQVDATLTPRETGVLTLLGQGLNSKEIAQRLVIQETTARNHIQNILSKLGFHSRLEAALYARQRAQG